MQQFDIFQLESNLKNFNIRQKEASHLFLANIIGRNCLIHMKDDPIQLQRVGWIHVIWRASGEW